MENAYGIGVRNRYDLFYNDDVDPFEILKQQEEEKERRKTEKTLPKEKTKPVKATKAVTPAVPAKKGKDVVAPIVAKPTETTEAPSVTSNKPRSRPYGDRNKSAIDDSKDNEERKNFRNREDHFQSNEQRERGGDSEFSRGGGFRMRGGAGGGNFQGRGRRRGRGGHGPGFGGAYDGKKRDFERHSGSDRTGVRHMDKREGGGANNWGSSKDDCFQSERNADTSEVWEDMNQDLDQSTEKKEAVDSTWGEDQGFESQAPVQKDAPEPGSEETPAENTESKENVPVGEESAEDAAKQMTLDEWKREQEAKRAVPKFNLRKPGEGEDNTQWKKLYMLKKKAKEEDDDEEEEEEDAEDEEFGRRGRQRQLVDIQINFSNSRYGRGRGRGGRGGRESGGGGPRGGGPPRGGDRGIDREEGGRGPGRMNRGPPKSGKTAQQSAPRVDDWNDFPSLVTA